MRRGIPPWSALVLTLLSPALCRADDPPLTVMTFNLRFASTEPPNSWPQRRPIVRALLKEQAPDVIGTQEGVYSQLKELAEDLPGYDWIGLGTGGGSHGHFMAVFYRKERVEPLEYDHFWLSDTPDTVGSRGWTITRRMVTRVRFKDRRTGREFHFFNTHLDDLYQSAREKSAALILKRVEELKTSLPVLLVGDFNAAADNKAYDLLVGEKAFADTWTTAEKRGEAVGTFHGFKGPRKGGRRLDWVLSRGPVTTLSAEVVTYSKDGQYPSDHFPVVARVRLGDATAGRRGDDGR